jgi:hypothetical protein
MNNFLVTIYFKYDILHKRPERYAVSDTIKEKIKQYINFTPKDIFRQLEQENPNLTQKQVHTWWANFIKQEARLKCVTGYAEYVVLDYVAQPIVIVNRLDCILANGQITIFRVLQ